MKPRDALLAACLGAATSLPLVALYYFGNRVAALPFVPFDVFDWLARTLPGGLITLFIEALVAAIGVLGLGSIGDTAKTIEQLLAVGLLVATGAALGLAIAWLGGRGLGSAWRLGLAGGALLALGAIVVESRLGNIAGSPALLWLILPPVAWGALLGLAVERGLAPAVREAPSHEARLSRRSLLLKLLGGSVGLALALFGLGNLPRREQGEVAAERPLPEPLRTLPTPPPGRIEPAPTARPEVTPTDEFYRIDINLQPVVVNESSWRLEVSGLFDRPRPLSLADLMAFPAVTVPMTLSCISNPVGGDLIGNAYWTGLRLRDLLGDLGLRQEAKGLLLRAADGFYESVTPADMFDARTLLVYGMNGSLLTPEHGFPLRILIPDRYGMKQPKWITSLEALDRLVDGYWPVRGWSEEALVQIMSQIDPVDTRKAREGQVTLGGIAWAGAQGISKVEVQVDNGPWQEAELRVPPLGPLAWTQWRYEWRDIGPGSHVLRVRATDGKGNRQIERRADPHPDGATGYDAVSVYQ